eukprot:s2381_g6.t1
MNLGWMEDLVQQGEWNLGWKMPHPRGLKGCAFFASSEVKTLTGINICRDRSVSWTGWHVPEPAPWPSNEALAYRLNRMFDKDRRAQEVARLLSSSRPVTLRVPRRPEQTDLDFEHSSDSCNG